jgi:glycosyltransferase involved in cell wall biosynthesis
MNQIKPKILYVITQPEWGGAQKYIYDLVNSSKARDFEVMVAVGQGKDQEFIDKLETQNIKIHHLKHLVRSISPLKDLLAISELKKLYKDFEPDIIHLNSTKAGIIGSLAGKNQKIIYTVHGWVFNEPLSDFKKNLYRQAEKLTAKHKNRIICISKLDYQLALDDQITAEDKLALVYNGIDQLEFLTKEQATKELQIDQIESNIYKLGTIANFYATKGLKYLLEAIYILKMKNIRVNLTIIGDGELRPQLENLIANFGLGGDINLVGRKKDGYKYLKAFDGYICSSVKEGLPYSILEAMQAELPIISSNVGGISEMITDRKNGILIESSESEKIAGAVKYLINNPQIAKKLGTEAKQIVGTQFSKNRMTEETFRLYKSVLED